MNAAAIKHKLILFSQGRQWTEITTLVEKADRSIRDAVSAPTLRQIVMVVFACQIVIVQALPLLGERPKNPVAQALLILLPHSWALAMAVCLGSLLLFSAGTQRWVAWAALAHAVNQIIIGWTAGRQDPYVGLQLGAYAVLALYVAASAWPRAER